MSTVVDISVPRVKALSTLMPENLGYIYSPGGVLFTISNKRDAFWVYPHPVSGSQSMKHYLMRHNQVKIIKIDDFILAF